MTLFRRIIITDIDAINEYFAFMGKEKPENINKLLLFAPNLPTAKEQALDFLDRFLPKETLKVCSVCHAQNCVNNSYCIICKCQF